METRAGEVVRRVRAAPTGVMVRPRQQPKEIDCADDHRCVRRKLERYCGRVAGGSV